VSTAPTFSVGELHAAVNDVLAHVLGDVVWVEGELRNLNRSPAGHRYFDLVDVDHDGAESRRPKLSVTLFDTDRRRVNEFLRRAGDPVRMTDGIRVRVGGRLRTFAQRSTLQLLMDRIDPAFTLGVLGAERTRLLAALAEEGVLRANASLALPPLPLHVALVTSRGSAAHADALSELERSGYGFRVSFLDARTQGVDAEASLVAALHTAAGLEPDVVVMVRGGGAATDLAAFDGERLARAIAASPVPVLTGIGHEIDRSVADEVAHTAYKTPTACAASLVEQVRAAERAVHDAGVATATAARGRVVRAATALEHTAHRCSGAALRHLARDRERIDGLGARAGAAARRCGGRAGDDVDALAARVAPALHRRLELESARLSTLAARATAHDPASALARGWSVTERAGGGVVRSPRDVEVGDGLVTRVLGGSIRSTVDRVEVEPAPAGPAGGAGATGREAT
jgi:exodeoxyribonuclease VII large subunit